MATDLLEEDLARLSAALDRLAIAPASPEALDAALTEAQSRLPWPRLHAALLERVSLFDTARDRMALVLHATDADVAGAARGKGEMAAVFEVIVAAADAAALDLFIARAAAVLESVAAARADLPDVARLIEIADQVEAEHEETADRLVGLAQIVEDLDEAEREAAAADG